MSIQRICIVLMLGLVAMVPVAAQAGESEASVFVVHGIPGADLDLDPDLLVDVSVNGGCALPGFAFGDIIGPLSLPADDYYIQIALADASEPCSNDSVLEADVNLSEGTSYSIIAHLTEAGTPTASVFENDLSSTSRGRSRLILQHTAAAPEVDITMRRGGGNSPGTTISGLGNGDQAAAEVRPGDWRVSIAPTGTDDSVFGPAEINLSPFSAFLVYAVGSLENGTFALLIREVEQLR